MECKNMTSKKTGVCKKEECHDCDEYEIFHSDTCNGEDCHCCASKGKILFIYLYTNN